MAESEPVLQFEQVNLLAQSPNREQSIDFILRQGELAIARAGEFENSCQLADLAQGLARAEQGIVRFLGQDWRDVDIAQANALRGRTGRISPDYAWISNLDLEENVTLSQRHATKRPTWEIRAEARRWSQAFGLPGGIPPGRTAGMSPDVLRRAACVRAFMGEPAMIVIEMSSDAGWAALHQPLADACQFARGRKTAVLWIAHGQQGQLELRPTIELSPGSDSATRAGAIHQNAGSDT